MSRFDLQRLRVPHVFTLLAAIVVLAAGLTWVVPSGRYERETRLVGSQERTLVLYGTFENVPKHYSWRGALLGEEVPEASSPVGLHGLLTAIPRGLEESADIIFFIFVIGGVFGIFERAGLVAATIHALLGWLGRHTTLLTVVVMLAIGAGGSVLGMGEEFIPLVPVFLLISKRLGYDRIFGLALVLLAADMGFAAATLNPFTVLVAQGIAEVAPGSGWELRVAFFAVVMALTIAYTLRYAARMRRDPSASLMAGDAFDLGEHDLETRGFGPRHALSIALAAGLFVWTMVGVQRFGWWMADMGGWFLLMGLGVAWLLRVSPGEATRGFVQGLENMVVPALVVGFARGIRVVLDDGLILDTLIAHAAGVLETFPRYVSVLGMLAFQSTLNFLIPSGSGQAAVTMPLMAPLADVLGITRQTAVFAFQCGDGFSNVIVPTSGILMAMLSIARVPYEKWLRFALPLFLLLLAVAGAFLVLAVAIGYS